MSSTVLGTEDTKRIADPYWFGFKHYVPTILSGRISSAKVLQSLTRHREHLKIMFISLKAYNLNHGELFKHYYFS